jgi:bacterioferritin
MGKLTNQAVDIPPLDGDSTLDADATVEVLNRILHAELDGVMQHFHHDWMSRWLRSSRSRALTVGQHIASLTGGPSLAVDALLSDALASSEELLDAARGYEEDRISEYRRLLELVAGRSETLESFARTQLAAQERHLAELAPFDD